MPWPVYEKELRSVVRYQFVTDALVLFSKDPLKYEPVTQHVYTSYGYNLLGCAVEEPAVLIISSI